MTRTEFRATPCSFISDDMIIQRTENGEFHCVRAEDPEQEEYSYKKPFILELEITRSCNLKCIHCYAEAADREFPNELTFDEIRTLLQDGQQLGIRELSLTGGEVFMRDDFMDIIDLGQELDYDVRFVTNATLLNDTLLADLCRRPVKMITVSLDSVTPEAHERIRGKGSHAPAMRNIKRLVDAGFELSIITAFSSLNIDEFDAILQFCIEHKLNWQVQLTSAKGRCAQTITLSPDEYYDLGRKVAEVFTADLPITIIPMDDLATFSHFPPLSELSETWQGRCTGGLLNLFIRANGDVTPCSALAFPECIVGNVRDDSLVTICQEERCKHNLQWLQPENLTGECASCAFQLDCNGGCPEILISMCEKRTENEYCYHRIEQQRILGDVLNA